MLKIEKNIYDKKEASDGERVLVMHLWPRGVAKSAIDLWMKELGCDSDLIHDWKEGKMSFSEFKKRYKQGLAGKDEQLTSLAEMAKKGTVSLLCSCKDHSKCHRSILKDIVDAI